MKIAIIRGFTTPETSFYEEVENKRSIAREDYILGYGDWSVFAPTIMKRNSKWEFTYFKKYDADAPAHLIGINEEGSAHGGPLTRANLADGWEGRRYTEEEYYRAARLTLCRASWGELRGRH